ncbi:MAG TPA: ribbon-helix-helix protein, CopG family [Thermoanaerobaculia bacterium]|nr:ribbon-helix-helix protein, CopG family [Thermoanaerobaculia bacterium]
MGHSLKVRLEESEIKEIEEIARRRGMTVDDLIRRVLLEAKRLHPNPTVDLKLQAVRNATRHEFPTGDIDQMLREIEQGHRFDPPA